MTDAVPYNEAVRQDERLRRISKEVKPSAMHDGSSHIDLIYNDFHDELEALRKGLLRAKRKASAANLAALAAPVHSLHHSFVIYVLANGKGDLAMARAGRGTLESACRFANQHKKSFPDVDQFLQVARSVRDELLRLGSHDVEERSLMSLDVLK